MPLPLSASGLAPSCPYCYSHFVHGHGSFPLKDGCRRRRFLCRACQRTFQRYTGTPLNYLKKRDQWNRFVWGIEVVRPLRQVAASLGVQVATAFRWRHRLMAALACRPRPVLTGCVAVCEEFVRYSEKGNRKTDGPGAWGIRSARHNPGRWIDRGKVGRFGKSGKRQFRRYLDGKPSCVVIACSKEQHVVAAVSRGRPTAQQLQPFLAQLLGDGSELWASNAAYEGACQLQGVPHRNWGCGSASGLPPACRDAELLYSGLYLQMRQFRGVATRYLDEYLAWFSWTELPDRTRPPEQIRTLLATVSVQRQPLRMG